MNNLKMSKKEKKTMRKLKLFSNTGVILILIGFLFMIGTAGTIDRSSLLKEDLLSFSEIVVQLTISYALVFLGIKIFNYFNGIYEKNLKILIKRQNFI